MSRPQPEQDVVHNEPKLFVGQLPDGTDEAALRSLMAEHGEVVAISLPRHPGSGDIRKFAMVTFARWAAAEEAMQATAGTCALGGAKPLVVRFADPPKKGAGGQEPGKGISPRKLFVGQVPVWLRAKIARAVPDAKVRQLFEPYGDISHFAVKRTERAAIAFVQYTTWAAAEAAMESTHGTSPFDGMTNPLVVRFADAKVKAPLATAGTAAPSPATQPALGAAVGAKRSFDGGGLAGAGLTPMQKRLHMAFNSGAMFGASQREAQQPYAPAALAAYDAEPELQMMGSGFAGLHPAAMGSGLSVGLGGGIWGQPGGGGMGGAALVPPRMGGGGMMGAGVGMGGGFTSNALAARMGGGAAGLQGDLMGGGDRMGGGAWGGKSRMGMGMAQRPAMGGGMGAGGMRQGAASTAADDMMLFMGMGGGAAASRGAVATGGAMGTGGAARGAGMGMGAARMGGAAGAGRAGATGPGGRCPWKLFVGQLPFQADEADVAAFFGRFGPVVEATVLRKDGGAGQSKGCGFVTLATAEDAEAAIAAVNRTLSLPGDAQQRKLIVHFAK